MQYRRLATDWTPANKIILCISDNFTVMGGIELLMWKLAQVDKLFVFMQFF